MTADVRMRGFTFGAPAVCSLFDLLHGTRESIVAFVHSNDIVPHLSCGSLCDPHDRAVSAHQHASSRCKELLGVPELGC